jgi:hypothetical protein
LISWLAKRWGCVLDIFNTKVHMFIFTFFYLVHVQCDSTSGFYYYSLDGFSISQNWTSSSSSPGTNTCSCPTTLDGFNIISATVFNNGSYRHRCVLCPAGYSVR